MITIGDHVRKARLDRGLSQKSIAGIIGVNECSINNWENNNTEPEIRYLPAIIRFLGYNPRPEPEDTLERLAWYKWSMGMNYERLGKEVGIHQEQLQDWLSGKRNPFRKSLDKIDEFLQRQCK